MGYPWGVAERGLLWLWLASLSSQLVEGDLGADIKALAEVTISRVQQVSGGGGREPAQDLPPFRRPLRGQVPAAHCCPGSPRGWEGSCPPGPMEQSGLRGSGSGRPKSRAGET